MKALFIQMMCICHFVWTQRFIHFHASAAKEVKHTDAPNVPHIIRFLQIHNINCYHSQVQKVKFKWGQVRIRQRGGQTQN